VGRQPNSVPQSGEKKEREKAKTVTPFQLYDIVDGMKAEGFRNGAKFAKRWFDGRPYSAYINDPKTGKSNEGRYDLDMIDTDTIKLSWLNKYPKIRTKFTQLLESLVAPDAIKTIKKEMESFLRDHPFFSGDLDTLGHVTGDLQNLHNKFQFQRSYVSMLDGLVNVNLRNAGKFAQHLGMSDVSASLGNFNFYAAIAKAVVDKRVYNRYNTPRGDLSCRKNSLTITHIYAYARDSYSFHDQHKASQYLGHWNRHGLVILWGAMAAHYLTNYAKEGATFDLPIEVDDAKMVPVLIKDVLSEKYTYYPVRNSDYVNWRAMHNRGGDFLIYSDLKLIELDNPIFIDLGEVCHPRKK